MSKMGISLLGSYRGAQIFEAIGIGKDVIEKYFTNTPSRIGGIGLKEIIDEALVRHTAAYQPDAKLTDQGMYRFKKNGELHAWSPDALRAMQQLRKTGSQEDYKHLSKALNEHDPVALKDLMMFKSNRQPIPLRDVEPAEDIMKRFTTAAMSLGSLSPEAHETIAIAMNRIGGKSNTGEGGEDPARFRVRPNGDSANSAIKQIASARFGVTAEYLVSAREIEIKMAQGSKPGEGGQLPGHKVSELIARLRRATPGVQLISPPPHHDIYSIEDLAQLIYDLKQVNPRAKICVKLVSEAGVGTIAAGVAKAHADVILISGHEGGNRCIAVKLCKKLRKQLGTRRCGSPAGARAERITQPCYAADRRRDEDRTRHCDRGNAWSRRIQFWNGHADCDRLPVCSPVPSQHLPRRHRNAGRTTPDALRRKTGNADQLFYCGGERDPRNSRQARRCLDQRNYRKDGPVDPGEG